MHARKAPLSFLHNKQQQQQQKHQRQPSPKVQKHAPFAPQFPHQKAAAVMANTPPPPNTTTISHRAEAGFGPSFPLPSHPNAPLCYSPCPPLRT
jgi:hypothetical protein